MSKKSKVSVYDTMRKKHRTIKMKHEVFVIYKRMEKRAENGNARYYRHEIQFSGLVGGENGAFENFREFEMLGIEFDPVASLLENEAFQRVRTAFFMLDGEDRDILSSLVVFGQTMREYSERMRIPLGTLHYRKKRAIARLRKNFKKL